jgi:hypothetical protein
MASTIAPDLRNFNNSPSVRLLNSPFDETQT